MSTGGRHCWKVVSCLDSNIRYVTVVVDHLLLVSLLPFTAADAVIRF